MSSPTVEQLTEQLTQFIHDAFDKSELADLCPKLGVSFEDVPGDTLRDKARGLVQYMNRRGRLAELKAELAQARPVPYEEAFGQTLEPQEPQSQKQVASTAAPATRPDGAQRTIPLWGWVAGLVLIALATWAVVNWGRQRGAADTAVIPPIRITHPADDSEVRRVVTLQGELEGERCAGCQLYIFVHPVRSQPNYYYLQSDAQIDLSADSFTANGVIVGSATSTDNNKQFEIWVALSANAPSEARLTADEWQAFQKEATDVITVTRIDF
jgi:hypothetical protein